eukprot:Nitzschia sp. Nitz4//scaffold80_size88189//28181//29656//NITZ4_005084-RA/size88189-processed-gene-0.29-mRNA-1//-1//CDS//3329558621//9001//frame0
MAGPQQAMQANALVETKAYAWSNIFDSLPSARCEEYLSDTDSLSSQDDDVTPALVSVHMRKRRTQSSTMGLTLINPTLSTLKIARIDSQSPLAMPPCLLRPGCILQSINGEPSYNMIPQVAYRCIQNSVDDIVLVFHNPDGNSEYAKTVGLFSEETTTSDLGMCLKRVDDKLTIQSVSSDSWLAKSKSIQAHDSLVSINGKLCDAWSPKEAMALMSRTPTSISLVTDIPESRRVQVTPIIECEPVDTEDTSDSANALEAYDLEIGLTDEDMQDFVVARFISISIMVATSDCTEGLVLENRSGKNLTIVEVPTTGPMANSPLRPGCEILSIGLDNATRMMPARALKLMRDMSKTSLNMIAMNRNGDPTCAHSFVANKVPGSPIGVVFGRKTMASPIRILSVGQDGLFANSLLNEQDVVLSVNGIPCEYKTSIETAELVRQDPVFASVLVKHDRKSAVVLGSRRNLCGLSPHVKFLFLMLIVMSRLLVGITIK